MKEKLLDLLVELCEDDVVREDLDTELFESGLIDSLVFAELLFGIEDQIGVIISPSEIDRADIDTPNKLIEYVRTRLA